MNKHRETLMKFIGEQNQRIQNDISKQGYKDDSPYKNNPSNLIQGKPGQPTSITMKGVSTPLMGVDEFGNKQYMQPGQEYQFPGSQVTETRVAKYGGLLNKTITCKNCGWSWKAADGGNDVSTCHKCGAENKIMQVGGSTDAEAAMRGMMKSKIGMGNAFGNAAIKRMSQAMPKTGMTPEGIGTHYMSSVDNYAVPLLQDLGEEQLTLVDPNSKSREAIRFNSPEEAQYFAEHYKDVAPMSTTFKGLQEYQMGGAGMMYADRNYQLGGLKTDDPARKEYAQKVVSLAEDRIKNNNYVTDIPQNVRDASAREGKEPFTCIGGACTVLKDAGVMSNVNWSNTDFAKNANEYGFTANQGWGLKGLNNLEPGDVVQYKDNVNESGKYYPSHARIFLGITPEGKYRFFDNNAKSEQVFDEYEIKDWLDPKKNDNQPNAVIFKVNPYNNSNPFNLTPEEKEKYDSKQETIKFDSNSKKDYDWSISPDAKNYNPNTKRVMDKFISFANDNEKINDLVKKTGKSKTEIQDTLLNVFGELGAENNWTTSKGKGLGSRLENIAESVITELGSGKNLSVGPGQIKYNSIPKDLKKAYNINSPNDLYDVDKVLPLMAAMDLKDKQVLENWGKNNTLSQKLFGFTNPVETEWVEGKGNVPTSGGFTIKDLPAFNNDDSQLDNTVGRYSPYLRNQYSSIAGNTITTGKNDWIPFNEKTSPNNTSLKTDEETNIKYTRDPGIYPNTGSYPYKVEQNWRNNLNRFVTKNEEGAVELPEAVVQKQSYGGITKYQTAGQVKYGTPEYTEAYNKGEVVTEEGVRSPIALDEVVIQNNYKRPRGFWEQSRDKYLKDNKDVGLLGAIGSVATYPLSVGQHALTYGTTGKVQDPSEAWGHNTNEGWFDSPEAFGRNLDDAVLNVFADPSNLIGAGILTKGKALSKLGKIRNISTNVVPELRQGLRTAGPSLSSSTDNLINTSKNLENLNYAKNWAKQYGYKLPENFKRIAQSNELTDKTVRGMMNRHNTFVRGASTNWDELAKKNPDILKTFEKRGIDWKNNPEEAAKIMLAEVPFDTGYGRYLMNKGDNALYTSNSIPTAQGYTYGDGYYAKIRRKNLDFSSNNREDWINNNQLDYQKGVNDPDGASIIKTDWQKRFPTTIEEFVKSAGNPNIMDNITNKVDLKVKNKKATIDKEWHSYLDTRKKIYNTAEEELKKIHPNKTFHDVGYFDLKDSFLTNKDKKILDFTSKKIQGLRDFDLTKYENNQFYKNIFTTPELYKSTFKNLIKPDKFAHYAFKGAPGEQIFDIIDLKKVTPDIWENRSRAHIGKYSEKLSAMNEGGLVKYQTAGVVKKWLGNTLTPEGYVTSTTKGGNRISFTGDQRSDEWINKQIDSGKFGFDPKTGGTFPLKKPVKGLSKEDQFIGSKGYYDLQAPEGFTNESQDAQIKNLPEFQQDIIDEENTRRRKRVVQDQWDEVYKSPLWYAPGMVAAGIPAVAALEVAGAAAAPYITSALATQLPGLAAVPGATVGNAITAGFAGHGLANVGPDAAAMYKNPTWGNAGSLAMDALEIAPIVGPAGKMMGEGMSAAGRTLGIKENAISKLRNIRDIAPKLESQIAGLKQQEALAEESRKALYTDYKAGQITAEEYTASAKQLNPTELSESRNVLEKQLREHKVKQEIVNTPQQNILKSEKQLGKDISDGGSQSKGVFEVGDDYVARLSAHGYDDASRLVNYADKIKSPRTGKTLQVKEIDGKVYQVQNKVTGTPVPKMSEQELRNVPQEHIDNFWKDKAELDDLGLSIDISGGKSNVYYDPKKGFQIIDLGIGKSPTNQVISDTYKGLPLSSELEPALGRYDHNPSVNKNLVYQLDEEGNAIPFDKGTGKSLQDEYVDELKAYYDSDEFKRIMREEYPDINIELYKKNTLDNLKNKITYSKEYVPDNAVGVYYPGRSSSAVYMPGHTPTFKQKVDNANTILPEMVMSSNNKHRKSFVNDMSAVDHELSHQRTNADELLPEYLTKDYLKQNVRPEFVEEIANNPEHKFNTYYGKPTEFDVRLKQLKRDLKRENINDYFTTPMEEQHIDMLTQKYSRNLQELEGDAAFKRVNAEYRQAKNNNATDSELEQIKNKFYTNAQKINDKYVFKNISKDSEDLLRYFNPSFLAKEANRLPAILPIGLATGATAVALPKEKQGGVTKYQFAGKVKNEKEYANVVQDNIKPLSFREKRGYELLIKETENAKKDKQELQTTGKIKNPRSIHYNKLAPKQSDLKIQTKSNEELEGQLGLERPLVYLANPEKLLGDLGVPEMETSELDRQAVMANRFNPYQSRSDRFVNNAKIGLGYVPEAAANTAMAAAFMPEGSGALGLFNEALNPFAGMDNGLFKNMRTNVTPELRQGLQTNGIFSPEYLEGLKRTATKKLFDSRGASTEENLKRLKLLTSPKTLKAIGNVDAPIADKMLYNFMTDRYPSVKQFRTDVKKATLEANRIKKLNPTFDFSPDIFKDPDLVNHANDYLLSKPESLSKFINAKKAAEKTIANKQNVKSFLEKEYVKKIDLINQDPILKNIAQESPQYVDDIYNYLKNPNKSTDEFVNDLIKQSNTFTRSMHKSINSGEINKEDFFTPKGSSWGFTNKKTIDVEGFPTSDVRGEYGKNKYKIFPNEERMLDIANTPLEERWAKRFPDTFTGNENIDFGLGLHGDVENEFLNKAITQRRIRNNMLVNRGSAPIQPKIITSEIIPKKYLYQPKHIVFNTPGQSELVKGFDVEQVSDAWNPFKPSEKFGFEPGYTYGFKDGGIIKDKKEGMMRTKQKKALSWINS